MYGTSGYYAEALPSKGMLQVHTVTNGFHSQVVARGEGDTVPRYNSVHLCGVDTSFDPAQLRFLFAEGRLPDGRPAGHHLQPHNGP
jgi:hypothetical protein